MDNSIEHYFFICSSQKRNPGGVSFKLSVLCGASPKSIVFVGLKLGRYYLFDISRKISHDDIKDKNKISLFSVHIKDCTHEIVGYYCYYFGTGIHSRKSTFLPIENKSLQLVKKSLQLAKKSLQLVKKSLQLVKKSLHQL